MKKTTLQEIENHFSLCDLLDLHEAMDIEQEIQEFYSVKPNKR